MASDTPKRWPYRGRMLSHAEAVELQESERRRVRETWRGSDPATVAGVDISIKRGRARAAVAVLSFPRLEVLEVATAERAADFPYIPGLLAFREVPVAVEAYERLEREPDLLFVDGHGRAHPRRFGVACALGVELDRPALGIGKSLFVGRHREPGAARGCRTRLVDGGDVIGTCLRTRDGVKPIYVSIGHRIDLATATRLALRATGRYRLPEPIRAAHGNAGAF